MPGALKRQPDSRPAAGSPPDEGVPIRILLVEDNPDDVELLMRQVQGVEEPRLKLDPVAGLGDALRRGVDRYDLVLLDLHLPDSVGLATFDRVHAAAPDVPVIIVTDASEERLALQAFRKGARDYLLKGQLDGMLLVRSIADACERARVRRELAELAELPQLNPGPVLKLDERGTVLVANRVASDLFGGASLAGQPWSAVLPGIPWEEIHAELERSDLVQREGTVGPEQFLLTFRRGVDPSHVFLFAINVTRRVEAERRLKEAEAKERELIERTDRLHSLGVLAAGVAHEVNNPLQGMLSHLYAIKRELPDDFARRESLDMLERGIETISEVVRKLLTLSSERDRAVEPAVAGEAVDFVIGLMSAPFRQAGIRVELDRGDPAYRLGIPHRDLVQVLMNLLLNARDAMPDGGLLTVRCRRDGGFGSIAVSDTGVGIPPELTERVFAPFFTTKGPRGTGLGLSVAESMARGCGGAIYVVSAPGQGSTFTVRIPLAAEAQP